MDIKALCLVVLAVWLVVLTEAQNPQIVPGQQPQNNQGIHMNQQGAHGSRFRDKQHIQDKEHLKEHYDGYVDFDHLNYEQMRDEEIAFHYFKIHDTDNNNRLDGLEIMQAMMHNKEFKKEIQDEEEEDAEVEVEEEEVDEHHVMDEATILTIVDQVLKDDDLNNDGHIMEHLEEVIDKPESEMTEAELQLHYFKMHDYDNNNKLDGLELIQALTHYHHDEEGGEPKKDMSEKELIDLIDPIFDEEDENKDGYIDYPEFAKTQS